MRPQASRFSVFSDVLKAGMGNNRKRQLAEEIKHLEVLPWKHRPKAAMVNATDGAVDGNTAALQLQAHSSVQPSRGACGV